MIYIFLDESGDLGFDLKRKGTTNFFIITFLITENKKPIEKLIQNIHRGLRKKYKIRSGSLHAAKEEIITISRFCRAISKKECQIAIIYLDKSKIYFKTDKQSSKPYNQMTIALFQYLVNQNHLDKNDKIQLIASRKETNKFLNTSFSNQLLKNLKLNKLEIKIKGSHQKKVLQAVDLVSWSIFRKYEHKDSNFYKILKKKICKESKFVL